MRRMSGPYKKKHITFPQGTAGNSSKAIKFLSSECPEDVLPLILAFAGPRQMSAFARTSKHWNQLVDKEVNYKVLCEELHKWKEGDDMPKGTWKQFYAQNPSVPTDYSNVHKAIAAVPNGGTIWLRPGYHYLRECLKIDLPEAAQLKFKAMILPPRPSIYGEEPQEQQRAILSRETYARNQSLLQVTRGNVVLEDVIMQ